MSDIAQKVADAADALQSAIREAEAAGFTISAEASTRHLDIVAFTDGSGYRQTSTTVEVKVSQVLAIGGEAAKASVVINADRCVGDANIRDMARAGVASAMHKYNQRFG